MKYIAATFTAVISATTAFAGSAVYVAPEVAMVEEPMRSGSGAWLIPLAIIAILALTLTGEDTESDLVIVKE